MKAFVFPGQGSQQKGMGRELFDSVPEYRAIEEQVDELLGYSVRELCINDKDGVLNETQYTQPALYVVNALNYYKALAKGEKPDYVAGHSLGEYNALLAAGAYDFMTGLELVKRRGELMSKATGGGMAAVIGLDITEIRNALAASEITTVDVANYNAPDQTVVSGPSDDIDKAINALESQGASMCMRLPVSGAFHSGYMSDAAGEFQTFLANYSFNRLDLPVVANVTARPYPPGDPDLTIRAFLVRQMVRPVKWRQTIEYLDEQGVREFSELGPGDVLTKLVEKSKSAEAA